jgi:hypothetical protein
MSDELDFRISIEGLKKNGSTVVSGKMVLAA